MGILDLIYPKRCLGCRKEGNYICKNCLEKVEKVSPSGKLICFWKYEGVIKRAILILKYSFVENISDELSSLLLEEINRRKINFSLNSIFVCIPLHKKRQNFRGFNQSEEIFRKLAKKLGYRLIPDLLIRVKNTSPQSRLTKKERDKNIKYAFVFNRKYKVRNKEREIVLCDDVWTTGSTIKEATRVLKEQGFKDISAFTIAR